MAGDKDREIADLKARLSELELRGPNPPANPYAQLSSYHDPRARGANGSVVGLIVVGVIVVLGIVVIARLSPGSTQGPADALASGGPARPD